MNNNQRNKNDESAPKQDFGLIPWGGLRHVEPVMKFGADKYEPRGYYQVHDRRMTYIKATMRHLVAFFIGVAQGSDEPIDSESGLPHLHHAAASILIAIDDSCDEIDELPTPTLRSSRDTCHTFATGRVDVEVVE